MLDHHRAQHEDVPVRTHIALKVVQAERVVRMDLNFLVLSLHHVQDDVRTQVRLAFAVAKPFVAVLVHAFYHAFRTADSAVTNLVKI